MNSRIARPLLNEIGSAYLPYLCVTAAEAQATGAFVQTDALRKSRRVAQ
jgi:hypothetical protein